MIQWVEARGPVFYPDALAGASPCGENLIVVVVCDGRIVEFYLIPGTPQRVGIQKQARGPQPTESH